MTCPTDIQGLSALHRSPFTADTYRGAVGLSNEPELRVDGEMTINRGNEVAQTLFASVRAHGGYVTLDLPDVTEFDTAGLQLVLMARRMVESNGHRLDVVQPSECVAEVLGLFNVALTTEPRAAS